MSRSFSPLSSSASPEGSLKHRSVPSPSAVFRYLAAFHEDYARQEGKAVIPPLSDLLLALERINADLIAALQKQNFTDCATLDMDATLIQTQKKDAFSYKGFKACQPLNTYWAEKGIILHTEFRDGNVPAGHEQLRVFLHALSLLPEGDRSSPLRYRGLPARPHVLLRREAASPLR